MSLLRFCTDKNFLLLRLRGAASRCELGQGQNVNFQTLVSLSAPAEPYCLGCRMRRGRAPRSYVLHPRHYIHMSRPREVKTIRIVEYCEEAQAALKEPHTDLSNVLQTRITQLLEPIETLGRQKICSTKGTSSVTVQPSKKTKPSNAMKLLKSTSATQKSEAKKNKSTSAATSAKGKVSTSSKSKNLSSSPKKTAKNDKSVDKFSVQKNVESEKSVDKLQKGKTSQKDKKVNGASSKQSNSDPTKKNKKTDTVSTTKKGKVVSENRTVKSKISTASAKQLPASKGGSANLEGLKGQAKGVDFRDKSLGINLEQRVVPTSQAVPSAMLNKDTSIHEPSLSPSSSSVPSSSSIASLMASRTSYSTTSSVSSPPSSISQTILSKPPSSSPQVRASYSKSESLSSSSGSLSSSPSSGSSLSSSSLPSSGLSDHGSPTAAEARIASQQLQNLRLAFDNIGHPSDLGASKDLQGCRKMGLGPSRMSGGFDRDEQHETDITPAVDDVVNFSTRTADLPGNRFDFDGEDVLQHDVQLLESVPTLDPKGLGEIGEADIGNASAVKQTKGGKRKRLKRKQFTEDAELYFRPYVQAAVFNDCVENAQAILYAFEKLNGGVQVDDYNTAIQAWARKGKWNEVRHLLARMVSKNVVSNTQTYAAALEGLARSPEPDIKILEKGLQQMKKESISLDDVFTHGMFTGDGRDLVVNLVMRLDPDYRPPEAGDRARCETEIVQDLYASGSSIANSDQDQSQSTELVSREDLERRIRQQWAMELSETVNVLSVEETGNPDPATVHRRQLLEQHRAHWRTSLKRALENEKTRQHFRFKNPNFGSICYYPFLSLLKPEEYVNLMLQALASIASTTEGSMTIALARDLSNRLFRKFSIRAKVKQGNADQIKDLYSTYVRNAVKADKTDFHLPREYFQSLEDEMLGSSSLDQSFQAKQWPPGLHIGIGTLLADMMLREIKIDVNMHNSKPEKQWIPALYHMYTYRSFKHVGFIKPHPTLVDLFQTAKDPNLEFDSNMLPMLTPPIPWTSVRFGAYPLSSTKIMRSKDGAQQHQVLLEKTPSQNLYPILDALNQLSTVPWIINEPVLDTVISVFRNGGSKELDIPQPSSACPHPPRITSDVTREELAQIHRERAAARKMQAEMHSLRMDMLYKLSIANKFRDEIMWFPHNMDFRGRVYPCPPHFNHFGNDVTRSLLKFAQGRPLGEEGFRWLKIHLVNLTGHKKRCSVDDRLSYAHELMPEIVDSADKPLDGNKWWQESDEPWQTLASCIEVTKAMRSGNPEQYVSHLPIHQDGSCNGLQHYAALGRDLIGAQQVNLHPYDVPQDVYSGVALMVEEMRVKDAAKGNKIAQALEGLVKRNVVKQTVMTVVYGVTSYGGRRQILKQLRDEEDLSADQKWFAAGYLTLKVFQSLRKMFTKTREIQDWLTESAWLISKAGETVEWVTPLGLPIIQPYHKRTLKMISQGGRNVYHEERHSQAERPDTMKQKNAFPPNFIHSLDSTHMMLTSLYSQRAGITFASVHDCFWTHASSVNVMNQICRNQFVKLHKEPILDNLADFMVDKYGQLKMEETLKLKRGHRNMEIIEDYVKNVPKKGEFDLDNVLDSTYFFS